MVSPQGKWLTLAARMVWLEKKCTINCRPYSSSLKGHNYTLFCMRRAAQRSIIRTWLAPVAVSVSVVIVAVRNFCMVVVT